MPELLLGLRGLGGDCFRRLLAAPMRANRFVDGARGAHCHGRCWRRRRRRTADVRPAFRAGIAAGTAGPRRCRRGDADRRPGGTARASSGGFSTPGAAKRTEVRTALSRMPGSITRAAMSAARSSRDASPAGRSTRFRIRICSTCTSNARATAIRSRSWSLILDRRLGSDWRTKRAPRAPGVDMSREDALGVLGLAAGASDEEIRAAHRRLVSSACTPMSAAAPIWRHG